MPPLGERRQRVKACTRFVCDHSQIVWNSPLENDENAPGKMIRTDEKRRFMSLVLS